MADALADGRGVSEWRLSLSLAREPGIISTPAEGRSYFKPRRGRRFPSLVSHAFAWPLGSASASGSFMNTTSLSLLDRLRQAKPDAAEWQKLQDIYLPLIRHWLARLPGLHDEIEDLTQDVLVVLFRELPAFERRRHGSFRAWLRQITVNRMWAYCKRRRKQPLAGSAEVEQLLTQLDDPSSELAQQWDRDHDRYVFRKLLALVEPDFTPATWQAFLRFGLDGQTAARVAEELGMSESAVVQAKSRVLKRMREEAGDLID